MERVAPDSGRAVRRGYQIIGMVLLGVIAYFALANEELRSGTSLFALACTLLFLGLLLLAVRSVRHRDGGSAVAWILCALPVDFLLLILSLHVAHPATVSANIPCQVAGACQRHGPLAWAPFALFVLAGVTSVRFLRESKRLIWS